MGIFTPFHVIVEAGMKFVPVRVKMNPELPAITEDGLSDTIKGAGLELALIVNSADPEFPPPGVGLMTLTAAEPEVATSAAETCACNCVLEKKVVVRGLPFH